VPEGFVFAVKAHRATTHGKAPEAAIAHFLGSGIAELGTGWGPFFGSFRITGRSMRMFVGGFWQLCRRRWGGFG
jgi:uncharacterized protein YecE (DUF72 family)